MADATGTIGSPFTLIEAVNLQDRYPIVRFSSAKTFNMLKRLKFETSAVKAYI
jgi:hypothetical protein